MKKLKGSDFFNENFFFFGGGPNEAFRVTNILNN